MDHCNINLPPGFRFYPTDGELITYLLNKVMDKRFVAIAIAEIDLNRNEPWELPKKAEIGGNEIYFYCQKDRKYPTGMKTNRATREGFWKATGKDKRIFEGKRTLVGMKKTLVFHMGRAPKGQKTNWVMHEYRLAGRSLWNLPKSTTGEWVVCRIVNRNTAEGRDTDQPEASSSIQTNGDECDQVDVLPPLLDYTNNLLQRQCSTYSSPYLCPHSDIDIQSLFMPTARMHQQETKNECKIEQLADQSLDSRTSPDLAPIFAYQSDHTNEDRLFLVGECLDLKDMWKC